MFVIFTDYSANDCNMYTCPMFVIFTDYSANNCVLYVHRLFSNVDGGAYTSKESIRLFIQMLDNYDPQIGQSDQITASEWTEINTFFNLIDNKPIFRELYQFLHCRRKRVYC